MTDEALLEVAVAYLYVLGYFVAITIAAALADWLDRWFPW